MPINIFDTAIAGLRLGNNEVTAAYLGNDQIFPNTPPPTPIPNTVFDLNGLVAAGTTASTWIDQEGAFNGTVNGATPTTIGYNFGAPTSNHNITLANTVSLGNEFIAWGIEVWWRGTTTVNGNLFSSITGSGSIDGPVAAIVNNGTQVQPLWLSNEILPWPNPGSHRFFTGIGTNLNDGNWHHLIYSWTGVTGDPYYVQLDGVLDQVTTSSGGRLDPWDMNFRIGDGWHSTSTTYNGNIGRVRMWRRALTTAEMLAAYNDNRNRFTN